MRNYYCPNCHRKVEVPAFLKSGNVKAEKGINVTCGNCKKGKVKIKPEDIPQKIEQTETIKT